MLKLTKGEVTLLNHLLKEHNQEVESLIRNTSSINEKEELTLESNTIESIVSKINSKENS